MLTNKLVDTELIAKLEAELELEKEMKGFEEMPESVKSFLEGGPFTVGNPREIISEHERLYPRTHIYMCTQTR